MALNPASTTGTGGWGLAPVGTASQSTMPLAPVQPTLTPEQIAQLRQQSVAMQTPPTQNIQSWTQGVAELVRAMQGNREADFARQQELQGRQQGAAGIVSMLPPQLFASQGGSSPSAAGAAPAGTLGSGPAGATASADSPTPSDASTPAAPAATADASAPRGIRNNNPLNIEDGQFARSQPGYAGSDGRFAKFEAPEHGVAAADTLLNSYQKNHGLNTVAGIVGRWAPASDNNDTKAYAAHVASQMGIGPNDPIPPEMRPQLIAAMARHENGVPLPAAVPKSAGPTGLLAPIAPPAATPPVAVPPQADVPPPTRLAYAGTGNLPPGIVPASPPSPVTPPSNPMVDAIAGRQPVPPADFARQAAAMEAAKAARTPADNVVPAGASAPISVPDFVKAAADMEAAKAATTQRQFGTAANPVPQASSVVPPAAAVPPVAPSPVPVPQPRPDLPLPSGSAIPGAVGPTSVNGGPLVPPGTVPLQLPPPFGSTSVNGRQLPQAAGQTASLSPMVSAIAGRPVPPVAAPAAGGGAPIPPAPVQVAQNGSPTSGAPSPAGAPSGLPQPLTSATGQLTQDQLTRVLANPWVPESAKASMLQMIQQRGQPQTMDVEGGKLMFNAAGQKVFIPEPKFGTVEIGSAKVPTVSHFDPATRQWNTTTLAPGGGVQTSGSAGGAPLPHPGVPQPDLSSIGGIQAAEVAQAGAKKAAEEGGTASAKYYDAVHRGLAGSAMIAAQQKQNIDALRQIANSPDFIAGTFADSGLAMQRLASGLGINPTGAAPRELFNQLAAKVLADQFSGLKSMASETGEAGGRVFKPMLDIEEKANITPEDSAAGIGAKLNLLDHAGNLMMQYGDLADDYIKDHGKLDAGFDKAIRKEIAGSRIPNVVPQETKEGGTPSAPISKTINGKTYYQINGKVYDNPEGK